MDEQKKINKLIEQKKELEQQIAALKPNVVSFSVDAGIINRLGKELVGRAETAVSELIKNAYDADANKVTVNYIDTDTKGGTLIIEDDGHGMDKEQLVKGFMRLSSSDKIHNPVSPTYKRVRAGKKGIGRFATQRLGRKLRIITKRKEAEKAIQVDINWTKYKIDNNLESIDNPIQFIDVDFEEGTKLIIKDLVDAWTEAQIKRVYRYVSELLQPDYLSDRSKGLKLDGKVLKVASQQDGTFLVHFYKTVNNKKTEIINEDKMVFNKAIAVIEGYIDGVNDGFFGIKSEKFNIDDYAIPILPEKKKDDKENPLYPKWGLNNVYFKAYYFIYNRPQYYVSISKLELKKIQDLAQRISGIRLYRNGFRVLPYGEVHDDWLNIDRAYVKRKKGGVNAPWSNKNFFGFVEVIDPDGEVFEETASREGLINNEALKDLRDYIFKALSKGQGIISEKIKLLKNKESKDLRESKWGGKSSELLLDESTRIISKLIEQLTLQVHNLQDTDLLEEIKKLTERIEQLKIDFKEKLDEIAMLRIWAGMGLSIGDFTHDVVQFTTALNGYLVALEQQNLNQDGFKMLDNIEEVFNTFVSYVSFFDLGTSKAKSREVAPIRIEIIVEKFITIIKGNDIKIEPVDYYAYDLYTTPMHSSEWYSIFFNLYSNSRKAIKRAENKEGRIKIIAGRENKKIYIEFLDNGDGIPDENKNRIFNAFFSTSNPSPANAAEEEELTGKGLGLKIIKDILESHQGTISIVESPLAEYKTCFRIEIPEVTKKQKKEFDL